MQSMFNKSNTNSGGTLLHIHKHLAHPENTGPTYTINIKMNEYFQDHLSIII